MIWIICVVHASESCFYLSILEENGVLLTYRKFNGWALLSTSYAIRPTNNVFFEKGITSLLYFFYLYSAEIIVRRAAA
jgi:hypothetical protein